MRSAAKKDRPPRHRRRRPAVLIAVAVVLVAAGVGLGAYAVARPDRAVAAPPASVVGRDLNGRPVTLDPGTDLTPAQKKEQHSKPTGAGRFIVRSVGLNVPMGSMDEVAGSVVPTGFYSAYWIANLGVSTAHADAGTVYVAMHSLRWGAVGPGNYLYDVQSGKAKIKQGAIIEAGGVSYVVDSTTTVPKPDLAYTSKLWASKPGRLVVITCLELPDSAPSQDNFIVTATLERTPDKPSAGQPPP